MSSKYVFASRGENTHIQGSEAVNRDQILTDGPLL